MDNPNNNENNSECLVKLIKTITHSGLDKLDTAVLGKIKGLCKKDDLLIPKTYELILKHMQKKHAEVRLSAFQLCAELFKKSHKFRLLVIGNLEQIFLLCANVDPEIPLPPPKETAEKLKIFCILTVQEWKNNFGHSYKQLLLCYNYFAQCKHVPFEEIQQEITSAENIRIERERHEEAVHERALKKIVEDIEAKIPEFTNTVESVKNCISLLLPTPEDFFVTSPTDEAEDVVVHSSNTEENEEEFDMRLFALRASYNLKIEIDPNKKINITRTNENQDIINNLKENIILIKKRYMNYIKKWRCDLSNIRKSDEAFNLVNNFANEFDECLKKYQKLRVEGIDIDDDDDENDDDFEVVDKEGYEPDVLPIFQASSSKVGESSHHVMSEAGSSYNLDHKPHSSKTEDTEFNDEDVETVPDWQDPELLARLKETTGIDLKMPDKKNKRGKIRVKKHKKESEHNFPGIVNLRKLQNTTKARLRKKLFSRATLRRISKNV